MNKTLVGIVTLGIGTLGMNALSSNDTTTLPSSVTAYNISDNIKKDESDKVIINKTLNNSAIHKSPEIDNEIHSKNIETKVVPIEKGPPPVIQKVTTSSSNCDPNYTGCVPIASDVDCAGGKGNGPAYVRGPVQVIGNDIYDLDRDNDSWGCE